MSTSSSAQVLALAFTFALTLKPGLSVQPLKI
jgi:hypothetical protein